MQDLLRAELINILQAVAFPAPGMVALAGRTSPYAGGAGQAPGVAMAGNARVVQLQQLFYDSCYCRRFGSARGEHVAASAADPGFIEALSAANASRQRWDVGWQIQQTLPSGQIVACKGAMTRMIWPGEFVGHGSPGAPPRPGTEISLVAPKEARTMQPGFYFAFGEALADQQEDFSIVRLYWNVTVGGAAQLLGGVTGALNRFAIPFRFKCLSLPDQFDRTDAAILYVAKRHYRVAATLLADVYQAVRPSLKAATPLFSKPLADGLGLAEDPKTGESFGMNRCRLLAEAVCKTHDRGLDAAEARLSEVAATFATAGLSLDRPYLNGGSVDHYEFQERRAA
jgi:type III HopA1-like effector protein